MASNTISSTRIIGGSFLLEDRLPNEIFTPEDFTEQHLLIAQTAQEFAAKEKARSAAKIEPKPISKVLKKSA